MRLLAELTPAMDRARQRACLCGGTTRCFAEFFYLKLNSWSRSRRVVGKAERLGDMPPRFIVTSLTRGEMANRIQEQQQDLFADWLSSAGFAANQLRLLLSAYCLCADGALAGGGAQGLRAGAGHRRH